MVGASDGFVGLCVGVDDGLSVVGWVANQVNPETDNYAEMLTMLEHKISAPKLGEVPYVLGVMEKNIGHFIDVSPIITSFESK